MPIPDYEVRERQTSQYSYAPHLDPQLVWAGKREHSSPFNRLYPRSRGLERPSRKSLE